MTKQRGIPQNRETEGKKILVINHLSAEDMLTLLRLPSGHPNKHGYPYTRSEMLRECERRGKKLLEDLGWPTEANSIYWHRDGTQTTLEGKCGAWRFSGFKHVLHEQEEALNKLTEGEFYGDFSAVGVECSTVKTWRNLLKKYPEVKDKLREAVRLHKGFYEHYLGAGKPIAEVVRERRGCECEQNIERLSRWLGVDVTKTEPLETLPKLSLYYGVWALIESCSPTQPGIKEILKHKRGQVAMDIFLQGDK